jgi:uncharacterized protein YjbJ (UPF0337 family)
VSNGNISALAAFHREGAFHARDGTSVLTGNFRSELVESSTTTHWRYCPSCVRSVSNDTAAAFGLAWHCAREPVRMCRVEVGTAQWREVMDENRVAGTARNLGGKAQEGLGRVVGDAKTQVEGIANQVKGTAQDLYGQARDGASQIADDTVAAARRTGSSFESTLRDTIETQPYTAVFVALGIGWLLGRMHRPL